jgi:hypothetical protein
MTLAAALTTLTITAAGILAAVLWVFNLFSGTARD